MLFEDLPALDLKQLSYFIVLAEQGSISSAAATLGLAQPSLSESITRLERKLEVQLVVRGTRGVQLTEAGHALSHRGREVLASAALAISEIRQLGGEARGPVSVALPPSLGLLLSVPLAETIQLEHPQIRLHIAEGMSGHVLEWLASGKLDFGCAYEISDSSVFSFRPFIEEQMFLVTAPDNMPNVVEYRADGTPFITGEALQQLPLVSPSPSHGVRKIIERCCRLENLHLNVIMEIDSLAPMISMVERASAYTILPNSAVMKKVNEGTLSLVDIVDPVMSRTAYLVRKRSKAISTASRVVEENLLAIIDEMIRRFELRATHCYGSSDGLLDVVSDDDSEPAPGA